MKVAIMQPYLFPYLGYFQLVNAADKFIFFDDANFIKRGWINRNNILINGSASLFTAPLKNASQNRMIREIELADYAGWRDQFLRSLQMAYKKAPYFSERFALISELLAKDFTTINELTSSTVIGICRAIGMQTAFEHSSNINPDDTLKGGQNRILHTCKTVAAQTYINPANGRHLYDINQFAANNIQLKFLAMKAVQYKQAGAPDFVPSLSVIDVLMHNSDEEMQSLLQECTIE